MTSSTANTAAVRITTSSRVIRPVWTGVADGAAYMSSSCAALGSGFRKPA